MSNETLNSQLLSSFKDTEANDNPFLHRKNFLLNLVSNTEEISDQYIHILKFTISSITFGYEELSADNLKKYAQIGLFISEKMPVFPFEENLYKMTTFFNDLKNTNNEIDIIKVLNSNKFTFEIPPEFGKETMHKLLISDYKSIAEISSFDLVNIPTSKQLKP